MYFIEGMDTYGGIVNYEYLPQWYLDNLDKVYTFADKMMILIGALAAFGVHCSGQMARVHAVN